MANRNQGGFGLRPVMTLGNTPATSGQSKYAIENGAAFNIYNGEPVILDRTVAAAAGGYLTNGCASGGTAFLGVFNGCFYNALTTAKPTWSNAYLNATGVVAGEIVTAFVNDNPFQEYEIALTAATAAAPITEDTIIRPVNPYAVTKVAQDLIGYVYNKYYVLNKVIFLCVFKKMF